MVRRFGRRRDEPSWPIGPIEPIVGLTGPIGLIGPSGRDFGCRVRAEHVAPEDLI